MGEIGTWKRKPADWHGIQAGWSCVTGQSSSNLLSDSEVEGICASAFKCLKEILATLFDAGYSYKSNYQKYKWFLRTLHSLTCISCMLHGLLAFILSWFHREGRQKMQVVCRNSSCCKQVEAQGVSHQSSITKANLICSHVKWMLRNKRV